MTKTYFMKVYNLAIYLLIYSLFTCLFGGLFYVFNILLSYIDIFDLTQVIYYIDLITKGLFKTSISFLIIACLFGIIDILKRIYKDSIFNHFKSVYYTISFRHFLAQSDMTVDTPYWDKSDNTKHNPITQNFNKAIKKCVVDVHKDKVMIFIKVPRMQQAQKLLKAMESDIKEEISSRHPEYYFSAPQRIRRHIWYEGQKRN
ncbi:hypothetical protein [Mammaliicoccus vitulinus]|uniref:hypothetical protein n=1 Tax=Mammaliicoccus vitulinus TaxID=71237 RepID=UPI000D1D7B7A|nr:hypothetical protein [Mammaliicoccus vitulinus]MDW4356538.1 hypothetical protein [Staphylococcus saprophyticus]PTI71597.1 hypothetical protein BU073_07235 [Mammaliicoccus vitulinus]